MHEHQGLAPGTRPLPCYSPDPAVCGGSFLRIVLREMEAWMERPRMLAKTMPLSAGESKEGNDC